MRKIILVLLLCTSYFHGFSQEIYSRYFTFNMIDTTLAVIDHSDDSLKLVSPDPAIQSILDKYPVSRFEKAYPFSRFPHMHHFFSVETDTNALFEELHAYDDWNFPSYFETNVELLLTPNDYGGPGVFGDTLGQGESTS